MAHASDIFSAHGLTAIAVQTAQGFLNTVHFAVNDRGEKFVLRIVRDDNRADIEGYITRQIAHLGAADIGGKLVYRDVAAQTAMHAHLRNHGIDAPEVVASGDDWMLMRHVAGRSLRDIYAGDNGIEATKAVLSALIDAHAKGVALWDRWGGNELVDAQNNVCFIDFDIDIAFPAHVDARVACALDLTFFLRGCVQYSANSDAVADAIAHTIATRKDFANVYDCAVLARFLDGQARFYMAEYIDNPACDAPTAAKHRGDNQHVAQLRDVVMRADAKTPAGLLRGFKAEL